MTADSSTEITPEQEELTAEGLQLLLDAGAELAKINTAIRELEIAYDHAGLGPKSGPSSPAPWMRKFNALAGSAAFKGLTARRNELRELLIDLG